MMRPVSDLHDGWISCKLGEIAVLGGGTTPSRAEEDYWFDASVPWATPSDITSLPIGVSDISETESCVSDRAMAECSLPLNPPGTVLMTSRATIGFVAINTVPMTTNQGFITFKAGEHLDPQFLLYWLTASRSALVAAASGSTFKELSRGTARLLPILLPPLDEQRRIAKVLRSVDEGIAAAQELVSQRSRLKSDLTNELLSGLTRTQPDAADWPAMAFSEAVAINPKRQLPRSGKVPFLDMASLPLNGALVQVVANRPVGSGGARFQAGDTLFARITPCAENGKLGFVSAIDGGTTAQGSTEFIVMGAREGLTLPEYVRWLSGWNFVRDHAIGLMEGTSGRQRIPVWAFDEIEVPIPSILEQSQIAEVLSSIDETLEKERAQVTAMKFLRGALMSDLLSGHIRVPA